MKGGKLSEYQSLAFYALQVPGWGLLAYLTVAQGLPALNYDLGVRMGTQEPAEKITKVGVAFWWGVALADLVFYVPILGAGLLGHWLGRPWGTLALAAALGITVYWPLVSLAYLATVRAARGAPGWSLPKEAGYWIVLPPIALWGAWGLWYLAQSS